MNPLPDRVVLIGLLATIGLCFALVFWSVRLNPRLETPLQWRDAPSALLTDAAVAQGPTRQATG